MTDDEERSVATLKDMAIRGKEYREDYEFELYGEDVTAVFRPLVDGEFLPIAAMVAEALDMEDDLEEEEVVDEAVEEVEGARDEEDDSIDITMLDDEFVALLQEAAILGLEGERVEGELVDYDKEESETVVKAMLGGYSVELGSEVLELSGSVRDAEKFRLGR